MNHCFFIHYVSINKCLWEIKFLQGIAADFSLFDVIVTEESNRLSTFRQSVIMKFAASRMLSELSLSAMPD